MLDFFLLYYLYRINSIIILNYEYEAIFKNKYRMAKSRYTEVAILYTSTTYCIPTFGPPSLLYVFFLLGDFPCV